MTTPRPLAADEIKAGQVVEIDYDDKTYHGKVLACTRDCVIISRQGVEFVFPTPTCSSSRSTSNDATD